MIINFLEFLANETESKQTDKKKKSSISKLANRIIEALCFLPSDEKQYLSHHSGSFE